MKIKIILALLSITSAALAQRDGQVPYMTKALGSAGIKETFVNTTGGSISVTGTDGKDARVEVYVNDNYGSSLPKEEAKQRLDKYYVLSVDAHDGELHASAKLKNHDGDWDGNTHATISFKIYVPVHTANNLQTSGGSIWLDNVTGVQQFTTSGGSLHVDHSAGSIKGKTSGGSIHLANSKENIDLKTNGGSINAESCSGTINLETNGGSVTLNNLTGNIKAGTSGGSIKGDDISGELITSTSGGTIVLNDISGSLDASTTAGSLHANFKQVGKYVKLDVNAGHIDLSVPAKQGLDLDITGNHVTAGQLSNFSGENSKDHIRGKLNGGGATVRADAGSGRVNLSFTN